MGILLDTYRKKLDLKLDEVISSNAVQYSISYVEYTDSCDIVTAMNVSNQGESNGGTIVTMVDNPPQNSPGTNTYYWNDIKYVDIYNSDIITHTVTVSIYDSSTYFTLVKITLTKGSHLIYDEGNGWQVFDSNGSATINGSGGSGTASCGCILAQGITTLIGGVSYVLTTLVTNTSIILLTTQGGNLSNLGFQYVKGRTAGANFEISSSNPADTCDVGWIMFDN